MEPIKVNIIENGKAKELNPFNPVNENPPPVDTAEHYSWMDRHSKWQEAESRLRTFDFGGCRIDHSICQCHMDEKYPCEKLGSIHNAQITFDGKSVIILD